MMIVLCLICTKRILSKTTQSVPSEIAIGGIQLKRRCLPPRYILVADKHLGMISVWSPTFALQLLDIIHEHQDEIMRSSEKQGNGNVRVSIFLQVPKSCEQRYKLKQLDLSQADAWKKLWPKL